VCFSLIGGVLLSSHIDATSKSEFSDEEDRSMCLGSLVKMVDCLLVYLHRIYFLQNFLGFLDGFIYGQGVSDVHNTLYALRV
jgi:hypothetical protein